jgi:uncharacterized protein YjbI with pentapeptide repeats
MARWRRSRRAAASSSASISTAPGCARLNYADLRDCNLGPLVVGEGRLLPSRLDAAELCHADLRGTDLRRAACRGADFSSANLTGARCAGADFGNAVMDGTLGLVAED